jgi:hypothetical protein
VLSGDGPETFDVDRVADGEQHARAEPGHRVKRGPIDRNGTGQSARDAAECHVDERGVASVPKVGASGSIGTASERREAASTRARFGTTNKLLALTWLSHLQMTRAGASGPGLVLSGLLFRRWTSDVEEIVRTDGERSPCCGLTARLA